MTADGAGIVRGNFKHDQYWLQNKVPGSAKMHDVVKLQKNQ